MKEDLTLVICQGLPASGKTTFARKWVEEDPKNRVRVNRDDIRRQLGPYWVPSREDLVTDIENGIIMDALNRGFSVIVDATNFRGQQRFLDLTKGLIVTVVIDKFDCDLEECIRRDSIRPKSERVGTNAILRMYRKYVDPTITEEEISKIKAKASLKTDPRLPFDIDISDKLSKKSCYIFDLDGTIALMNGRSPYDGKACESDVANYSLVNIMKHLRYSDRYADFIILSGRNGESRDRTLMWLKDKGIPVKPKHVFMRKPKDFRSDVEVKEEMFNEHIKNKYFVHCIFDDRDVMVQHWRSKGLPCFHVYYGDF